MVKKKNDKYHHMALRGDVWYFVGMFSGRRYHQRLSDNEKKALELRDDYLYEIRKHGDIVSNKPELVTGSPTENSPQLGQIAVEYKKRLQALIDKEENKTSAMTNYRSLGNLHILPRFGNIPVDKITKFMVDEWKLEMEGEAKSINNRISILRSIFEYAKDKGYIDKNIMEDVKNLSVPKKDIYPLLMEEIQLFLAKVNPFYQDFFVVAFYTGMRFGEMAGLLWKNVDFKLARIKVSQTRVDNKDGKTKTVGSFRDIDMLPPVAEAMKRLQSRTGSREYVFYDCGDRLMTPDHVREVIWKKGLRDAGIKYRPLIQTRHTFATLMIDSGEDMGWVQRMMGHTSLQMIYTRYYAWVKKPTRNDGGAFMAKLKGEQVPPTPGNVELTGKVIQFTPVLHQKTKKGLTNIG